MNCTLQLLNMTCHHCTREQIIINYIHNENKFIPVIYDNYQFGVPTKMSKLSKIISNYTTYWGFDSFLGLPDEKKGIYVNPFWTKGKFALANKKNFQVIVWNMRRILDAKIKELKLSPDFIIKH